MTGARGNLLPPSPEPLCTRFVGEDGAVDEVEESDAVDEIKSEVVVRVSRVVEDWVPEVRRVSRGIRSFGIHGGIKRSGCRGHYRRSCGARRGWRAGS